MVPSTEELRTRTCRKCQAVKPETAFDPTSSGYRRRVCSACTTRVRRLKNPEKHRAYNNRHRAQNPHRYVVLDSRSWDLKHGFEGNDLDADFVQDLISGGCSYCGATELRMTLDRTDNSKAHTKSNVVPCCIRCNYLRGSMPYAAWEVVAPAVRQAYQKGLFGDWRAVPISRKKIP